MRLNPWIHHTLVGFGVFNLLIGTTLLFWYPKVPLSIVSSIIPQSLWASVFILSGLTMLYGLYTHNLRLLRYLMVFGLFLKLMWEIGLLFRLGSSGGILSVELWGMIAYLQLLGVIYFSPRQYHERA